MTSTSSPVSSVKVNVRLCGSVPRDEIEQLSLVSCAPLVLQSSLNTSGLQRTNATKTSATQIENDDVAAQICSQLCHLQQQNTSIQQEQRRVTPEYEAPAWAVPANGEAKLEPICDSVDRQSPIDLTDRAVFRIGRSPQSDVQLLHATSSRKHAMLFHHSNGSCYIIDCNSAHGTYVNGVRITSNPKEGVVFPHKVRRGSIIRFGGPGAPCFMLKSFSFFLDEMRDCSISERPTLTPTSAATAEVQHNTRFNSLGTTARNSLLTALTSKRSFDSMSTVEDVDFDCKRPRCSSPPLSPQEQPLRLVSPDLNQPGKRRRVSFSNDPPTAFYPALVSPDLSSDENDCEEQ